MRHESLYQRLQRDRDKSITQERGFKAQEDLKNRKAIEHMPDQRSVLVYFHPDAQHEKGPELEKYATARTVGGRMHERPAGELEKAVPVPKTREQLCDNIFKCNPWDAEPLLLDDLNEVKRNGTQEDINHVREMIRAVSWGSPHQPRTDRPTAAKLALELQEEAEQQHVAHRKLENGKKQTELSIMDPDVVGMEDVVATLTDKQKAGHLENAIEYIESRIEAEWKNFIKAYELSDAKTWPEKKKYWPGIGVQLPEPVKSAADRVIRLRRIRNQLYFHLLYPVLASHAWEG